MESVTTTYHQQGEKICILSVRTVRKDHFRMKDRDEKGQFLPGHQVNAYTEEQLQTFFDAYCKHRASGKDKESFSREGCDFRTIERWVNESIMPTIHARMSDAEAKGWDLWESLMFNVGFGIPTEINAPTKDDPNRKHTIESKFTQPHILIFMMKSKFRSVYGDKMDSTSQSTVNLTGSTLTYVIDPATGEPVHFDFSTNPATGCISKVRAQS